MRAYIIRDQMLSLQTASGGNYHNNGSFQTNFSLGKLEPVLNTETQRVNCARLEALIISTSQSFEEGVNKRQSNGIQKSSKWDASVIIHRHKEFEPASIVLSGQIFFFLYNLAFPNEVSVKLTMKEYALCDANQYEMNGSIYPSYPSFSTNEMMIKLVKSASGEMIGVCRNQSNIMMSDPELEYRLDGQGWMEMPVCIMGKFTIEVTLHNFLESCSSTVLNCENVLKQMIGSDFMIVTDNDKEFLCHRSFLAANSPVLKAMFENDMIEARSGRIEMSEISEEGAKAFLAYVYCQKLDKAKEVSSVAFELFNCAEKYNMSSLKVHMKTLFLGMPSSWWKIEIALKMYFFVGKLCDGEELKRKALQVLKNNFNDVMESDCYKNLFNEDPKAAMVFCNDLINSIL